MRTMFGICAYVSIASGLGDKREMIRVQLPERLFHGRCYVKAFGIKGVLSLPNDQQDKLTMADLGVKGMRAVLAQRTEAA